MHVMIRALKSFPDWRIELGTHCWEALGPKVDKQCVEQPVSRTTSRFPIAKNKYLCFLERVPNFGYRSSISVLDLHESLATAWIFRTNTRQTKDNLSTPAVRRGAWTSLPATQLWHLRTSPVQQGFFPPKISADFLCHCQLRTQMQNLNMLNRRLIIIYFRGFCCVLCEADKTTGVSAVCLDVMLQRQHAIL